MWYLSALLVLLMGCAFLSSAAHDLGLSPFGVIGACLWAHAHGVLMYFSGRSGE
jgi:hypothetical protein